MNKEPAKGKVKISNYYVLTPSSSSESIKSVRSEYSSLLEHYDSEEEEKKNPPAEAQLIPHKPQRTESKHELRGDVDKLYEVLGLIEAQSHRSQGSLADEDEEADGSSLLSQKIKMSCSY